MKQYTIYPQKGMKECFTLIVAPTVKEIRSEIRRVFRKIEREPEDVPGTAGMFSPACTIFNSKHPGGFNSDMFGYMFLAEEMLGAGYVAHECLHAAMAHERQRIRFSMDYGDNCNDHEERLAYYLTDCVREVWITLLENGHVKANKKSGGK